MEPYRHTYAMCGTGAALTIGLFAGAVAASILLPIGFGYYRAGLLFPLVVAGGLSTTVPLLFVLFSALTVEVGEGRLSWSFRFGFPRRSLPLTAIDRVETEQAMWWGLGIRWWPRGRHYAAGARKGIVVRLRNGKRLYLDTDEPKFLEFALRDAIAQAPEDDAD